MTTRYEKDPSFHSRTNVFRVTSYCAKYIVEVEVYVHDTFVLKFYPLRFKRLKNKYRYISGDNILKELLGTCLAIFKGYFDRIPTASFGFMATGSIVGDFQENQENNQRFQIYKQVMQNVFGDETFAHYIDVSYSAYLMANRANQLDSFVVDMQHQFCDMYPDILNLQFTQI